MTRDVTPEAAARLAATRLQCAAERDDAIGLLERAREALDDVVEPEALRRPLRRHLAATIEMCQRNRSLFGLPVNYALDMARAILDEPEVT